MSALYSELNGQQCEQVSLFDRGLAYGDGIFTTAKVVNGEIQHSHLHQHRLANGLEKLLLPAIELDLLFERLTKLVRQYSSAVLKIMITAGSGGRGYARSSNCRHNIMVSVHEFPQHYQKWQTTGIHLGLAETQLGINPQLAGIKHLNRLEQVLIKAELESEQSKALGYDDLLVTNINGDIVEANASNIFWLDKNSQLYTPSVNLSGVNGIARQVILVEFPQTKVVTHPPEVLADITAMFICNSLMGLIPVKRLSLANNMSVSLDIAPIANLAKKVNV